MFDARAKEAAKWIREGGLKLSKNSSQVSKKCWAILADINECGMITVDSQEGRKDERAYVHGFMKPERAKVFVEMLNCSSKYVSVLLIPCKIGKDLVYSTIAMTRKTKNEAYTRLPLFEPNSTFEFLKKNGKIPLDDSVFVCAFDPVWGRETTNKKGLYPIVLKCLKATKHT
jgi:hypothetical protein